MNLHGPLVGSVISINVGILPRRSKSVCSLIPALVKVLRETLLRMPI